MNRVQHLDAGYSRLWCESHGGRLTRSEVAFENLMRTVQQLFMCQKWWLPTPLHWSYREVEARQLRLPIHTANEKPYSWTLPQ